MSITLKAGLNELNISLTPVTPVVTVADIRAFLSTVGNRTNADYMSIALDALIAYKETGSRTNLGYWDIVKAYGEQGRTAPPYQGLGDFTIFVDMVKAAGLEPGPVVLNWGAFVDALDRELGGPVSTADYPEYLVISNCYAFATYVAEKFVPSAWLLTSGPQVEDFKQLGYIILKVGLEHPELLGPYALAFHAPGEWKWGQDGAYTTWMAKFGVMPYAGFSWEDKALLITQPGQDSPEMVTVAVNTVAYIGQQAGVGPFVDIT